MIESNKRLCKRCGQLRTRTEAGRYPSSKNKRYVDEEGKLWNGKVAPCCHTPQIKSNMRQLRMERKLDKIKLD